MSVMLIDDPKAYARLLKGIQMFRMCEMEYIQRFTELSEERAEQLFYLHCLNMKSWNNRYKNDEPAEQVYTKEDFIYKVLMSRPESENYTTVEQVLKSLQFLDYQIEEHDIKLDWNEIPALKWLRSLITDCQSYLLRKHTQYESAKWGL